MLFSYGAVTTILITAAAVPAIAWVKASAAACSAKCHTICFPAAAAT